MSRGSARPRAGWGVLLAGLLLPCGLGAQAGADAPAPPPPPDAVEEDLAGLEWRSVGPAEMGGRVTDVAAIPGDRSTVYFATATGGLWKTTDAGTTWAPIFEDRGVLSIGDIALAPSDPSVLYVGTGENNPRNSTSIGNGVHRSTDGGKTWAHLGLEETERIGRIVVHPRDPDVVWVAAMGHLWGPNEERGVYRSRNGGRSWERVLYVDEDTGAADLALHPTNPRILYASTWDHRRRPWHFRSGGPGSGLWRSTDGGDSWTELTAPSRDTGLPPGPLGRIGVATTPAAPDLAYAIVESEAEDVLWRSGDAGESWRPVSRHRGIASRPFYYSDLRIDPTDEHTLYALASGLYRSVDGGRSWERIARNIHGDHHALWIDPEDPDRLLNGNDGGFHTSPDGGDTWAHENTVPLAQFYRIGVDTRRPYRVCGGLQDNDAWCGPSRTLNVTGILRNYWHEIVGPGDGMYVEIDPRDPDRVFVNTQGGDAYAVDLSTGEARSIHPYPVPLGGTPAGIHPYRFNWTAPLLLSPHDPDVLYLGGNVLFRTRDGGASWAPISPDLSDADSAKLVSSGGITPDNTTAEHHATIHALDESPLEPGVLWAGTDDGNLHLSRDGGETWTEVTGRIPDLPPDSWVSRVEASPHAAGTAWVAFDRHRSDDPRPYVYRTTDHGRSWTDVSGNLPTPGWVHVVREDPRRPGLLYAGTETGIWASWTGGGAWASLRLGLPPVAVRDLVVHPEANDLVIGTHGRSIHILDDIGPLQELPEALAAEAHLFAPRPAVRYEPAIRRFDFDLGDRVFVGENPPYGALLTYRLAGEGAEAEAARGGTSVPGGAGRGDGAPGGEDPRVRLHVLDAEGDTLRTLEGPGTAGVHRVAWDLREAGFDEPPEEDGSAPGSGEEAEEAFRVELPGPRVLPGTYTVALSAGEAELRAPLEVRLDPRLEVPREALAAQRAALRELGGMAERIGRAVRSIDGAREQLEAWERRLRADDPETAPAAGPRGPAGAAGGGEAPDAEAPERGTPEWNALADSARALSDALLEVRRGLADGPPGDGNDERPDAGTPLAGKVRSLARDVGRATAPPTAAQSGWAGRHRQELEEALARLEELRTARLARFNARVREAGIPAVDPRPR